MKLTTRIAAFVLFTTLLTAFAAEARSRIYVRIGPPPIVVEHRTVAPQRAFVWQPGYHQWTGAGYVWVPGRWVAPPYSRARWVPGRWRHTRHGYYWEAGRWRR